MSSMSKLTDPADFDGYDHGYIIVAPLSDKTKQAIYKIQDEIANHFPRAGFWFPRGDQLHVTFAHVITTDSDYSTDREELYEKLGPQVIDVLSRIVSNPLSIETTFNVIQTYTAAITIQGHDDGSYEALRQTFTDAVQLPEGTRRPPNIIHSSIGRFRDEIDYDKLKDFVDSLSISFSETTTELLFVREKKIYMQEHDIIARFPSS